MQSSFLGCSSVLASNFRGRTSVQEWQDALELLKKDPHKDIFGVLEISYNSLNDVEKNNFLDIIREECKDYIENVKLVKKNYYNFIKKIDEFTNSFNRKSVCYRLIYSSMDR